MTTSVTAGAAPSAPSRAPPPDAPRLTIGEELERLAPGWSWDELRRWPPDVFAFTAAVLADSGVYRTVVCPPAGTSWPPLELLPRGERWSDAIASWAREWMSWAAAAEGGEDAPPPEALTRFGEAVLAGRGVALRDLDLPEHWALVVALLALHAMADEACARAGTGFGAELQHLAGERLAASGSLARLPTDRVRVLPKLRPPQSGITLRSVSRHLALDRSEVETAWYVAPRPPRAPGAVDRFTMLLVPYPAAVHATDFRPVRGPLLHMDERQYGFFEFDAHEPLEPAAVVELVASAARYVGDVDAVVLPEAAVKASAAAELQRQLWAAGVPYLVTGVRSAAAADGAFGVNYAHFGAMDWSAPPQHKHHRWCVDPPQVEQYHLGAALAPDHRWWEAIEVQRRRLTFVTVSDWLTVCPLVCEDLARPDPVTDVVRAIGPTLVVALLLDGPQLAARWPARYASVLADDPGSSVLTLTALGMAERSQPPGTSPSRVIALWKDPRRGLQEIPLAPSARAVALTAHARRVEVTTADGRCGGPGATELVLSGIEQIP
jgi:hypothetical protein